MPASRCRSALYEPADFTDRGRIPRGEAAARQPDRRPTAIFAASDEMAIGALLAARELGYRVPEDSLGRRHRRRMSSASSSGSRPSTSSRSGRASGPPTRSSPSSRRGRPRPPPGTAVRAHRAARPRVCPPDARRQSGASLESRDARPPRQRPRRLRHPKPGCPPERIGTARAMTLDLEAIYIDLHRHPELSFQETRTAGVITATSTALGIEIRSGIGGPGAAWSASSATAGSRRVAARRHGRAPRRGAHRSRLREHGARHRPRGARGAGDARVRARHARHRACSARWSACSPTRTSGRARSSPCSSPPRSTAPARRR